MTDHKEIIQLLEAMEFDEGLGYSRENRERRDQALILLRTAQEPVSNETEVRHPIDSNGKVNYKISYCYYCGQHVKNQLYCQRCGSKLRWPARPDCSVPEQPNCEGCEFFKHNNKYEHCWRYTQLASVCKLRQDHKEQPPASELTDWLRKTISGDRHEKGDKELQAKVREACDTIDRAEAEIKQARDVAFRWQQIAQERKERADKTEAEIKKYIEMDKDKSQQSILATENYTRLCKQLEAKDELLFAYESVKAPVNPLLAINKDLAAALTYIQKKSLTLFHAKGLAKTAIAKAIEGQKK